MYAVGQKVEHFSGSKRQYVSMTIIAAHADDLYDLSGKKGVPVSKIRRVEAKAAAPVAASGPAVGGKEVDEARAGPATPPGTGGDGSGGADAEQASGHDAGGPQGSAAAEAAGAVAEMQGQSFGAYCEKAAEFLRLAMATAEKQNCSLVEQLAAWFPAGPELRAAILLEIPWKTEVGYITFLRQPKGTSRGRMHVAMLAFSEDSYPGKGVHLADALMILKHQHHDLDSQAISVRPRTVGLDLANFAWMPDGSIANGTRTFALTALGLYSTVGRWQQSAVLQNVAWNAAIPYEVVELLTSIDCKYTRYDNLQSRVLANLVDTAVHAKTNRSIEDPVFMSREMLRCNMGEQNVKTIMSLFKQRTLANPALRMQKSTEDATLRFMHASKIAESTLALISAEIAQKTWQGCTFTSHALMASKFPVGGPLATWFDDVLIKVGLQTAQGQLLAVELAIETTAPGGSCLPGGHITQSDFDYLCGACGMWVAVKQHVLPQLAFGSADVAEMDQEFRTSPGIRAAIASLLCKEPEKACRDFMDLATWVVGEVAAIRLAKEAKASKASQPGRDHPSAILNEVEKAELSTGIYIGQLTLDINVFRDAARRVSADAKADTELHETNKAAHISDVRSAQEFYQLCDICFDAYKEDRNKKAGSWVESAVASCRSNMERLVKVLRCQKEDMAVVNIFAFSALGTLKLQVLDKVKREIAHLPGLTLVMHPLVPSDAHQVLGQSRGQGSWAVGFSAVDNDSDTDVDALSHDFTSDTLPEAITKVVGKMSSKQRAVRLAKDYQTIERALVFENASESHYAKRIHCAHVADSNNSREVTDGLLLIPAADDILTGLEASIAMRHGMFTDVPTSCEFVGISKKTAMLARRALAEGWSFAGTTTASPNYNQSKVARGQLGAGLYTYIIKDLLRNCNRKVLVVNDLIAGCGEIGVAAVGAKNSEEAISNSVRLCYFGCDHRRNFHEVASARVKTATGQAYLDGKLVIDGRRPVQAPAERNLTTRSQIASLLAKPLVHLTVSQEGDLVLPQRTAIPVQITSALSQLFDEWEAEFPRPAVAAPAPPQPTASAASAGAGDGAGNGSWVPAVGGSEGGNNGNGNDLVSPGTSFENKEVLAAANFDILKETPCGIDGHILLLAKRNGVFTVFLKNVKGQNAKIEAGSFVGKGGPGEFTSGTQAPAAASGKEEYEWHYTRITEYKKDTAKYANGGVVLVTDASTPDLASTMRTLAQCEEILGLAAFGDGPKILQLYGHSSTAGARGQRVVPSPAGVSWFPLQQEPEDGSSFVALNMGQWVRSRDVKVDGKPNHYTCQGLLRPCFEISMGVDKTLKPSNKVDSNPLCLFTVKPLMTKPNSLLAL